jgi:hypothetical protein
MNAGARAVVAPATLADNAGHTSIRDKIAASKTRQQFPE